jgi:molybdate/tungstate transport system ATP-binding protein
MIELRDVSIRQGQFRLDGVSLTVPAGGYAVLMGKTGCGKTTLLEAVAGLRRVAGGRVLLGGRDVTGLDPAARGIGYVPQDGALFRTMSVRDNLAFGLRVRHAAEDAVARRVETLADWLDVRPLLDRQAVGLSGGETQRIALGRALAASPAVLLMDEPLGALDEETRDRLIRLLKHLREFAPTSVLHVSHSRVEAEQLGDVVFRLQDGRVEVIKGGTGL